MNEQLIKAAWENLGGEQAGSFESFKNQFAENSDLRKTVWQNLGGEEAGSFESFEQQALGNTTQPNQVLQDPVESKWAEVDAFQSQLLEGTDFNTIDEVQKRNSFLDAQMQYNTSQQLAYRETPLTPSPLIDREGNEIAFNQAQSTNQQEDALVEAGNEKLQLDGLLRNYESKVNELIPNIEDLQPEEYFEQVKGVRERMGDIEDTPEQPVYDLEEQAANYEENKLFFGMMNRLKLPSTPISYARSKITEEAKPQDMLAKAESTKYKAYLSALYDNANRLESELKKIHGEDTYKDFEEIAKFTADGGQIITDENGNVIFSEDSGVALPKLSDNFSMDKLNALIDSPIYKQLITNANRRYETIQEFQNLGEKYPFYSFAKKLAKEDRERHEELYRNANGLGDVLLATATVLAGVPREVMSDFVDNVVSLGGLYDPTMAEAYFKGKSLDEELYPTEITSSKMRRPIRERVIGFEGYVIGVDENNKLTAVYDEEGYALDASEIPNGLVGRFEESGLASKAEKVLNPTSLLYNGAKVTRDVGITIAYSMAAPGASVIGRANAMIPAIMYQYNNDFLTEHVEAGMDFRSAYGLSLLRGLKSGFVSRLNPLEAGVLTQFGTRGVNRLTVGAIRESITSGQKLGRLAINIGGNVAAEIPEENLDELTDVGLLKLAEAYNTNLTFNAKYDPIEVSLLAGFGSLAPAVISSVANYNSITKDPFYRESLYRAVTDINKYESIINKLKEDRAITENQAQAEMDRIRYIQSDVADILNSNASEGQKMDAVNAADRMFVFTSKTENLTGKRKEATNKEVLKSQLELAIIREAKELGQLKELEKYHKKNNKYFGFFEPEETETQAETTSTEQEKEVDGVVIPRRNQDLSNKREKALQDGDMKTVSILETEMESRGMDFEPTPMDEAPTTAKAYDFDDTLYDNATGQVTELGQQVQEAVANGEDVQIISARENTAENRQFIADKLGIDPNRVTLVGSENQSAKKAAALDKLGIDRNNFIDVNEQLQEEVRQSDGVEQVAPVEEQTTEDLTDEQVLERVERERGSEVGNVFQYGDTEGVLVETDNGFAIQEADGTQTLIEGSLSGRTNQDLGLTKVRERQEIEIDEAIAEPNEVETDFATNTVRAYGKDYQYGKVNLNEDGDAVSVEVIDNNGNIRTIRNPEMVAEIESQKIIYETEQAGGQITEESVRQAEQELGIEAVEETQPTEQAADTSTPTKKYNAEIAEKKARQAELEEELSDWADVIEKEINQDVDEVFRDMDNSFTRPFDDRGVDRRNNSPARKRNAATMAAAFARVPTKVRTALGADNVAQIRELIEEWKGLSSELTPTRVRQGRQAAQRQEAEQIRAQREAQRKKLLKDEQEKEESPEGGMLEGVQDGGPQVQEGQEGPELRTREEETENQVEDAVQERETEEVPVGEEAEVGEEVEQEVREQAEETQEAQEEVTYIKRDIGGGEIAYYRKEGDVLISINEDQIPEGVEPEFEAEPDATDNYDSDEKGGLDDADDDLSDFFKEAADGTVRKEEGAFTEEEFDNRDRNARGTRVTSRTKLPRTKLGKITKALLPVFKANGIRVVWHTGKDSMLNAIADVNGGRFESAGGFVIPNKDANGNVKGHTIHLYAGAKANTSLHELFHPVVAYIMKNNKAAFRELLKSLRASRSKAAVAAKDFVDSYYNSKAQFIQDEEALTEGLANAVIDAVLQMATTKPNVFKRIIAKVLQALGLTPAKARVTVNELLAESTDFEQFGAALGRALAQRKILVGFNEIDTGTQFSLSAKHSNKYGVRLAPNKVGVFEMQEGKGKVYFKDRENPITGKKTGEIELDLLSVPEAFREQGFGSAALDKFLAYADELGRPVYLMATPKDRKGLTQEQLINFYRSRGFRSGDLEMEMTRQPQEVRFSRTSPQITVEQAVKRNNGNPLNLAPNGKPSKLYQSYKDLGYTDQEAERLTAQVYSDEFISWFGDWLNDPENASKVVDENGQPLLISHATSEDFTTFDFSQLGKNTEYENTLMGAFFAEPNNISELKEQNEGVFGENTIHGFLNLRNPLDIRISQISKGESAKIVSDFLSGEDNTQEEAEAFIDDIGLGELGDIYSSDGLYNQEFKDYIISLGIDGLVNSLGRDSKEFIAFEPNQIKSATENVGTFSSESNDIRFSLTAKEEIATKNKEAVAKEVDAMFKGERVVPSTPINYDAKVTENAKINRETIEVPEEKGSVINTLMRNLRISFDEFIKGRTLGTAMSDNLGTKTVKINGKTIKANGGLGYPFESLKDFLETGDLNTLYGWAGVGKSAASGLNNAANKADTITGKEIKEMYREKLKDTGLDLTHLDKIPDDAQYGLVAVYRMGEDGIKSNLTYAHAVVQLMKEKFGEERGNEVLRNSINSFLNAENDDIKALRKNAKKGVPHAVWKLNTLKSIETVDDLLAMIDAKDSEGNNRLSLSERKDLLVYLLPNPGTVPDSGRMKPLYDAGVTHEAVIDIIGEKSMEGITPNTIMQVIAIEKGRDPIKNSERHENYPYASAGLPIGVLENTAPTTSLSFPAQTAYLKGSTTKQFKKIPLKVNGKKIGSYDISIYMNPDGTYSADAGGTASTIKKGIKAGVWESKVGDLGKKIYNVVGESKSIRGIKSKLSRLGFDVRRNMALPLSNFVQVSSNVYSNYVAQIFKKSLLQVENNPLFTPQDKLLSALQLAFPNINVITDNNTFKEVAVDLKSSLGLVKPNKIKGFALKGEVYLDKSSIDNNLPIHEYGHIWTAVTKVFNPEVYQRGIELAKQSPYFKDIVNSKEYLKVLNKAYPDVVKDSKLNKAHPDYENAIEMAAEEALVTAIGDKGEAFVTAAQRNNFLNWLNELWNVLKDLVGFQDANLNEMTFGQFTDAVIKEMLSGGVVTDLTSEQLAELDNQSSVARTSLSQGRESTPQIRFSRTSAPAEAKRTVSIGLTPYAAERIPKYNYLNEVLNAPNTTKAEKQEVIKEIEKDLELRVNNILPKGSYNIKPFYGVWGETEISFELTLDLPIEDALFVGAKLGQEFDQDAVHVRQFDTKVDDNTVIGIRNEDGSATVPYATIEFNKSLTNSEFYSVLQEVGLFGGTLSTDGRTALVYNGQIFETNQVEESIESNKLFNESIEKLRNYDSKGIQGIIGEQGYTLLHEQRRSDGEYGGGTPRSVQGTYGWYASKFYNKLSQKVKKRLESAKDKTKWARESLKKPIAKALEGITKLSPKIKNENARDYKRLENIGKIFDRMGLTDMSPEVVKAYSKLADALLLQYKDLPIKVYPFGKAVAKTDSNGQILRNPDGSVQVEFIPETSDTAYDGSGDMINDVNENNQMVFYTTGVNTFGEPGVDYTGHPLLEQTGINTTRIPIVDGNGNVVKNANGDIEYYSMPMVYNDLLRVVHDYIAHAASGATFGARGEERAWAAHVTSIINDGRIAKGDKIDIIRALTTETRGQNTWVNFVNEKNKKVNQLLDERRNLMKQGKPVEDINAQLDELGGIEFSDQKVGLLPTETIIGGYPETQENDAWVRNNLSGNEYVSPEEDTGLRLSRTGSTSEQARNEQFLNFVSKRPELVQKMLDKEGYARGYLLKFQQEAGVTLDVNQLLGYLKKQQAEQKLQEEAQKQAKEASSQKAKLNTGLDEAIVEELDRLDLKDSELPRYTRRLIRSKIVPQSVKILVLNSEAGVKKRSLLKEERIALAEAYLEGVETKEQLKAAFNELKENYTGTIDESMLWRTAALVRIGLRLTTLGDINTVAEINELLVSVSSLAGSVLGTFSSVMDDLTMIGAIQLGEVAAISKKLNKLQPDPKNKGQMVKPSNRIKLLSEELSKLQGIQDVVEQLSQENSELKQRLNKALSTKSSSKVKVSAKLRGKSRKLKQSALDKIKRGLGITKRDTDGGEAGVSYSRTGGSVDGSSFIDPTVLEGLVELMEHLVYESGGDIATARGLFNEFLRDEGLRGNIYKAAGGKFDIFEAVSRTEGFKDKLIAVRQDIAKQQVTNTLNTLLRKKTNTPLVGLVAQLVNSKNAKRNAKLSITNPLDVTATEQAQKIFDEKRAEAEQIIQDFKEGNFNKEVLNKKLATLSKELSVALDDAGEIITSPEFNASSTSKPVVGDIISVGRKTYRYDGSNWINESSKKGASNQEIRAINFALQNNYITQSKINEARKDIEGGFINKDEALMAWNAYKESISHLPENRRRAALNKFEDLMYDAFAIDITGNVANRIGVSVDLAMANTSLNELLQDFYIDRKGTNLVESLMEKLGVNEELANDLADYIKGVLREQVEQDVRNTIGKFVENPNSINKAVDLVMDGRMNMDDFQLAFGEEYGFTTLSPQDIKQFRDLLDKFRNAKYSVDEKKALDDIREFLVERKKETWIQAGANIVRDSIYTTMLNAPTTFFTSSIGGGLALSTDITLDSTKVIFDTLTKFNITPAVALQKAIVYGFQGLFNQGLLEAAYIFKTGESSRTYMAQDPRSIKKSKAQKLLIDKYNEFLNDITGGKGATGALGRSLALLFLSVPSFIYRMGKVVILGDALIRGFATPYNQAMSVYYDFIGDGNKNVSEFLDTLHKEMGRVPEIDVIIDKEISDFGLTGKRAKKYAKSRKFELRREFGNQGRLDAAERISGRYALMQVSEGLLGAVGNGLARFTNVNTYDRDSKAAQLGAAVTTTFIDLLMPFVLKIGPNFLNFALSYTPYNLAIKPIIYKVTKNEAFNPNRVMVVQPAPGKGLQATFTERSASEKIKYWGRASLGTAVMLASLLMFDYDEDDEGNLVVDISRDEKGKPNAPFIVTGKGTSSFSKDPTVFEGYERNAVLVKRGDRYVKLFNTDRQVIGSMFAPMGYITDMALFGEVDGNTFANNPIGWGKAVYESLYQGASSLVQSAFLTDLSETAKYISELFSDKSYGSDVGNKEAKEKTSWQYGITASGIQMGTSALMGGNFTKWASDMYLTFNNSPQVTTPDKFFKSFTDRGITQLPMWEDAYTSGIKRLPGGTPLVKAPNLFTDVDILDNLAFGSPDLDYTALDRTLMDNPRLNLSTYYYNYSAAGMFENGVASEEFRSKVMLNHPERFGLFFDEVQKGFKTIDEEHEGVDGYKVRNADELRMKFLESLRSHATSHVKAEAMLDIMESSGVDFGDRRRFLTKTKTIAGVELGTSLDRLDHTKVKEWLLKRGLTLGEDNTVKEID